MSDAYVECLVKTKTSTLCVFFKYLLIILTVVFGIAFFITMAVIALLFAIVTGVAAYFVNMYTDIEYEYLYLDKELTVDKVMAKTKRKRVAVYQLDRIEILAPIKSYHLDNYNNRNAKALDFSIGYEDKPDLRYVMYYEGGVKLLLSPSPEMVKLMKNVAPRKIFMDCKLQEIN